MNTQHTDSLLESLELLVDSSHVVYDPGHIFDVTGIDVPVSLTGEDLVLLVKEYLLAAGVPEEKLFPEAVYFGEYGYEYVESDPVCNDRKVNKAGKKVISVFQPDDAGPEYVREHSKKISENILIKEKATDTRLSQYAPVVEYLESIGVTTRASMERHLNTVDMLLANLVINSTQGNYTRIDMHVGAYNGETMSFTHMSRLVKAITASKDIEFIKGYRGVGKYKKGMGTQVRFNEESPLYVAIAVPLAKDDLQAHLNVQYGVYTSRHKQKTKLDPAKTTQETADLFTTIKSRIEATTVSIPMDETQDPCVNFLPKITYADGSRGYDLTQTLPIHQVYSRKDMKAGGRYYNRFLNLKKETRSKVLFNGAATTEVDIKSCFLSILATMEGVELPAERYNFGKVPVSLNKLMINTAINCRSTAQAYTKLASQLDEAGVKVTVNSWIADLYAAYPWMIKYVGAFQGNALANHESKIMAQACVYFMSRTGSLALPIHDGVRVQASLAGMMSYCIIEAWMGYWYAVDQEIAGKNIVVTCLDNTYNGWDRRL
jgi:hypothetical protein